MVRVFASTGYSRLIWGHSRGRPAARLNARLHADDLALSAAPGRPTSARPASLSYVAAQPPACRPSRRRHAAAVGGVLPELGRYARSHADEPGVALRSRPTNPAAPPARALRDPRVSAELTLEESLIGATLNAASHCRVRIRRRLEAAIKFERDRSGMLTDLIPSAVRGRQVIKHGDRTHEC